MYNIYAWKDTESEELWVLYYLISCVLSAKILMQMSRLKKISFERKADRNGWPFIIGLYLYNYNILIPGVLILFMVILQIKYACCEQGKYFR
jgi:hypothetical protein